MLSVTSPFTALLVLAASFATPSLAADTSTAFVVNEAASANAGTRKIELDYLASPGWGWSMTEIMSLEPALVRFQDEVDFTPAYDIVDGTGEPLNCRLPTSEDDFFVDVENDDCKKHCMNHGRYCDHSLLGDDDDGSDQIKKARKQFFAKHNVQGHQLVEESVRRLCVWNLYGKENHQLFFDYHQAMQASGCDAQLTHDCVQASLPASMDYTKLYECVQGEKGLDPLLDEPHALLEEELQHSSGDWKFSAGRVALFGEGHAQQHVTEFSAGMVFSNICFAFKNDLHVEPPLVCDFCQNYCPHFRKTNKGDLYIANDQHCAWSLQCEDNGKTFDDYLASKNTTADAVMAAAAAQKAQNKQDPAFAGNVRPTSSSSKTVVETAGGMAATLLAMLLVGGLLMMAIMAIRVWRTKVIIERYVREQEELSMARARNDHGGDYGDHNHHDEAFFPDGNELDLDLEPALQYRDHIGAPAGASSTGPSSATFLPKLT